MAIRLNAEIALVNDSRNLLINHEGRITTNANQILLRVTSQEVDDTLASVLTSYAQISLLDSEIDLLVAKSDYTGTQIRSRINLGTGGVKIVGKDFISLEGLTTINGNFKIDSLGNMETVNGKFTGQVTANSGLIGRFAISGNDLVYTSDLFYKDYDDSDLARLRGILAGLITQTSYDLFVYDLNNSGGLSITDLVQLRSFLNGTGSNPNKLIRSVIRIGTNTGEIKTSAVAQNGAVGTTFSMRADKLSGNLVSTQAFATQSMLLEGKEVTIDSNGFLKAT